MVASLEALPRGPGFDPPRGRISALGLKKTPSLVPRPKHCGARPNSQGDGPPCTGGAGVRGFSWPAVRRSFYLSNNAVGAVSPPQVKFFFICFSLLFFRTEIIAFSGQEAKALRVPKLATLQQRMRSGTFALYLGIAAAGFLRGSALTRPCMLASSGRQAGMLALEPTV